MQQIKVHNLLKCDCGECCQFWDMTESNFVSTEPLLQQTGQIFKMMVS